FKLLDESQVVLRAPRKDGVYNLDLKNIVPSGDTLNRFKIRGFGILLEACTKADTKHDIGPTCC
ncbi:hypothetical protein Tco_1197272, partial [Tanacetum coccineum]